MAVTINQKVDLLFKKIGFGKAKTDTDALKSPSNESIASGLLLLGDRVWTESGLIPLVPPATTNTVVGVLTGSQAVKAAQDTTSTPNRSWLTNVTDWIPTELGSGYQVRVYVDETSSTTPEASGTQIFPDGNGNSDGFYFDYQSGVLNFIDTNVPSAITPSKSVFVSGYRYLGKKGVAPSEPASTSKLGMVVLDSSDVQNPTAPRVLTKYSVIDGGAY